jgi:hypothetical protein
MHMQHSQFDAQIQVLFGFKWQQKESQCTTPLELGIVALLSGKPSGFVM